MKSTDLAAYVAHFQKRVLQDALTEATSSYWLRRAETYEWARPRPGDYIGESTRADIAAQDRDLAETARACRARAAVSLLQDDISDEVTEALREAS